MVGLFHLRHQGYRTLHCNARPTLSHASSIGGYTKAVMQLLSSDELVRQYMLQIALYIAAHYGNVDLVGVTLSPPFAFLLPASPRRERCFNWELEAIVPLVTIPLDNGAHRIAFIRTTSGVRSTKRSSLSRSASFFSSAAETIRSFKNPTAAD